VESRKFAILDLLKKELEEKVTGRWDIVEEEANLETTLPFVSFANCLIICFLVSGSPGFSQTRQLIGTAGFEENYSYFLFCDWKTSWSLLYRPIDEKERKNIDKKIQVLKYVFNNF